MSWISGLPTHHARPTCVQGQRHMFECIDLSLFAHAGEDIPQLVRRRPGLGMENMDATPKRLVGTSKKSILTKHGVQWVWFLSAWRHHVWVHKTFSWMEEIITNHWIILDHTGSVHIRISAVSHPKKSIESSWLIHIFQSILSCANSMSEKVFLPRQAIQKGVQFQFHLWLLVDIFHHSIPQLYILYHSYIYIYTYSYKAPYPNSCHGELTMVINRENYQSLAMKKTFF